MNDILISVIIPAYNVAGYVEKAVESILAQTESRWELLLINDGSTDDTGARCRVLADGDKRIRYFEQSNAGVSAARNRGLDEARGEYVTFVDSDDALLPETLQRLLEEAQKYGADIVEYGFYRVDQDKKTVTAVTEKTAVFSCARDVMDDFVLKDRGVYSCWSRLYRREIIGDIRFRPYQKAEDALFNAEVISRVRISVRIPFAGYYYLERQGSATRSTFTLRGLDVIRSWIDIYAIVEKLYPHLMRGVACKLIRLIDSCYRFGLHSGSPEWKKGRRLLIRWHSAFYLRQYAAPIPLRKRLANAIYRIAPELFYRLAGK